MTTTSNHTQRQITDGTADPRRIQAYSNAVRALKNVSLTIPSGMSGLLGPNGAGKPTLMRILATLQEADEGSVQLGDLDVITQKDDVRRTLGYLPHGFGVYPNISAEEREDDDNIEAMEIRERP